MTTVSIVQQEEGHYVLTGELTFATVPNMWRRSAELFHGSGPLNFDLTGITRSDSAALALLLEWIRWARRRGREIRYHNLPRQLLAVAAVSGADSVLHLAHIRHALP